jgi:predicted nucleic acid-binding protein
MAVSVFDTSVLIGFLRSDDDLHLRSRAAMADLASTEWVVPTTVCAELLVGAYRTSEDAVELVDRFLSEGVDRIEPLTLEIACSAAVIRAANPPLSLPDAFVLATGDVTGADVILTADRRWARVSDRVRIA